MSDATSEKATVPESTHVEGLAVDDGDHIDIHNEQAFKGDDSDGKVAWTFRTAFAACMLAMLYVGSQVLLYFLGSGLSYITADLNAVSVGSWLPVSNTLAITAVVPFAGYLQDLLGRRNITLFGLVVVMIGIAVFGSAPHFGQAVAGTALTGAGAGICELTSLAGIADVVPVRHRGIAMALMIIMFIPFIPNLLYATLVSTHSTWRWLAWICLIYNAFILIGLALTYFPKSHPRMEGMTKRKILARIDYVGAVLSITGVTIFLVAIQAGGYTHPWTSGYVLAQLIVGIALIAGWVVWEWKFAKYPMIPKEMFTGQRIVGQAFLIAFVAGMNFYSIVNFFPMEFFAVFPTDPVQMGVRGLAWGIPTVIGAILFGGLLSTNLHPRWAMLGATSIMTAFSGGFAAVNPDRLSLALAFAVMGTFGVGGVIIPSATLAMIVVPDSLLATTAGLSLGIRTVGGSIGFTIYYNIFINKLNTVLPATVAKYAMGAGLSPSDAEGFLAVFLGNPANLTQAPGYSPAIAEAAALGHRWGYANALKYVWYASIPFGAIAIIFAATLPSIRKYQTNRVAVAL